MLAWIGLLALLVSPPGPSLEHSELAIVLRDPATGAVAGLRLSDGPAVADTDFILTSSALTVRLEGSPVDPGAPGALGFAQGPDSQREALALMVQQWQTPERTTGLFADDRGVAFFEGAACGQCRVAKAGRGAVATVGLLDDRTAILIPELAVEGAGPVDRLLELASRAGEFWTTRSGPRSGMLVVVGGSDATEVIAVDKHGSVGRRLMERHLRHLADVELPHRIAQARKAASDGDAAAFVSHRNAALVAADRALTAFPTDIALVRTRTTAAMLAMRAQPTAG